MGMFSEDQAQQDTTMFMLGKEVKWKNNSHLRKQQFSLWL